MSLQSRFSGRLQVQAYDTISTKSAASASASIGYIPVKSLDTDPSGSVNIQGSSLGGNEPRLDCALCIIPPQLRWFSNISSQRTSSIILLAPLLLKAIIG